MFGIESADRTPLSWSPRVGVFQALEEINNKSDGVADELLPHTRILVSYNDSKCDATVALQAALHLTQNAFDGQRVAAIIGAGCSGASLAAAQVAEASKVPIISPSSHSPELSDGQSYPYFLRTCPSDAYIAAGMIDILQKLLEYTSVGLVTSTDGYGAGAASAFSEAAISADLTLSVAVNFRRDAVNFDPQHQQLLRTGTRVIVLFAQGLRAARFVHLSLSAGLGGDGYLWLLGDESLSDPAHWSNDDALRLRALKGSLALMPSVGHSAVHAQYLARQRQRSLTRRADGSCSSQMDDDRGAHLWGQHRDGGSTQQFVCASEDPYRESVYDAFGYDAVMAVALALHDLIEVQKRDRVTGIELLDSLLARVHFDGVSGLVDLFDAAANSSRHLFKGDRRVGFSLSLLNYENNANGFLPVGLWMPCSSATPCSWPERWQPLSSVGLTFSTSDNSQPQQMTGCLEGEISTGQGVCACDGGYEPSPNDVGCRPCEAGHFKPLAGTALCQLCPSGTYETTPASRECKKCHAGEYQPEEGQTDCLRCPVGQDSLRGSAECTRCADGFYRQHARLPAAECKSCSAIQGMRCHSDATTETLDLNSGWWRLSVNTSRAYKCKVKGNVTACLGGMHRASICAPGHAGPLRSMFTQQPVL